MFAFVMYVLIVLPPMNAVAKAHPIHRFTINSTPAYSSREVCQQAVQDTGEYIGSRLPEGSRLAVEADCAPPVVFEIRF